MQGCYLLHFERPISDKHSAQHYLGYAKDLHQRIRNHRRGYGSRFSQVATERGIDFTVVREWPNGDRSLERRLKRQKNSKKLCWICNSRW